MKITGVRVRDIRFPTSRNLDGSDALNVGDYSATYVIVETDGGASGHGLTFTNGRGNELTVAAVHALQHHVIGLSLDAIQSDMRGLYRKLYDRRHCHSIEVYEDKVLVGGLYGVTLGRAFFGESMFHRARDASKVALVHLAARLKAGGYALLDAQFPNPHLEQFGAVTVTEERFQGLLAQALSREADFYGRSGGLPAGGAAAGGTSTGGLAGIGGKSVGKTSFTAGPGWSVLQVITQTS